ncbi:MAG TPA: hypothetical protein VIJ81_02250 [Sphingomicrobium sp.]
MAPSLPTARYRADKEAVMERQGEEVHLNETEATGAVKAQGVRYVLGISLLLVVIAMSAVWIIGSVLG